MRSRLELRRSTASFHLEHDLAFDPLFWRHYGRVAETLRQFQPDILHITGPSDVGQLGACLGHRLSIPMVGSWHTNVHQYMALRWRQRLSWLPVGLRLRAVASLERHVLSGALLFYQIPRVLVAPNEELVELLARRTKRPAYLMTHGVDTSAFAPEKRERVDGRLQIGFVGRLSAEKQVRVLPVLERALQAAGVTDVQLVVIGEGSERAWLERQMPTARFCGVLRGEALARAYANLDLFVFPSESETFGLVVLEAMASGVPVIAMSQGGPRCVIEPGVSGLLAHDERGLIDATLVAIRDKTLRVRLGTAARARALAWSWDRVFDQLYDIYAETPPE